MTDTPFTTFAFNSDAAGVTTPRTMPERLSQVLNVMDYGAVGDSNTAGTAGTSGSVNSTAFEAARDELYARGGGALYFPGKGVGGNTTGIYRISRPLDISQDYGSFELYGDGPAGPIRGAVIINSDDFDGLYLIDRAQQFSGGSWPLHIRDLGFVNRAGGGIRNLGGSSGLISRCNIEATTWGINMGGRQYPPSVSFTGTTNLGADATGHRITAASVTGGLITNYVTDPPLPVPITGTGISGLTYIMSQVGSYTGGAGDYITLDATSCSSNTIGVNPNAPSAPSCGVYNCRLQGIGGSYNVDPTLSFAGVGIAMGPNTIVRDCHINNWGTGITITAGGTTISGIQAESNTIGIRVGVDGSGATGAGGGGVTLVGGQLESNYTGLQIDYAAQSFFAGLIIQGNTTGDHNSTYGIRIGSVDDCVFMGINCGGTFLTAGTYVEFADSKRNIFLGCSLYSVVKAGGVSWAAFQQSVNQYDNFACTLAELNTYKTTNTDIRHNERHYINDATVAPASQTYHAVVSGGGSYKANVVWDGSNWLYA